MGVGINPNVKALATWYVDKMLDAIPAERLQQLPAPIRVVRAEYIVRLSAAMQQAIEDECEGVRVELEQ